MAQRRENSKQDSKPVRSRPATTPEGRENQLISRAVDLAEQQLSDGTASAQVISHYLRLGSSRERLEQERMGEEVKLLRIKAEQIASQQRVEELYAEALGAMRRYQGAPPAAIEDGYDD